MQVMHRWKNDTDRNMILEDELKFFPHKFNIFSSAGLVPKQ